MAENDELRAAAARLRLHNESKPWEGRCTSPYAIFGDPSGRVLDVLNLHRDQGLLADAYLAHKPLTRERVAEWQRSLLSDVAGLCHSEANRWERASPKTSEHWRKAAVELQAAYLAAHAMLADGLTRERIAAAVGELFTTRNGASSGRVMELLRDDRLTIRQFTPSVMIDELCRLLGVTEGE